MAHQTGGPVPVQDYTGTRDPGRSMVPWGQGPIDPYANEWTLLNQQANTKALYDALGTILPIHPALGGKLQALGRSIMDVATGQGTTTAKERAYQEGQYDPSSLDRVGGLMGTWTGRGLDDIGQALGLTAEDLAKVSRAMQSLSNNPEAQGEFLRSMGQALKARYGGDEGLLAGVEDFGSPGMGIAAGRGLTKAAAKAFKAHQKTLLSGTPNIPKGESIGDIVTDTRLAPADPIADMPVPDWNPDDSTFYKWLKDDENVDMGLVSEGHVDPGGAAKVDLDLDMGSAWHQQYQQWDNDTLDAQITEFKDTLKNKNVKGMEIDEQDVTDYTKQLQDLLAERKRRGDKGGGESEELFELKSELTSYSDSDLDLEINETNQLINGWKKMYGEKGSIDELDSTKEYLQELVKERHRRRREGGGGSAGAQKTKSGLEQMKEAGMKEPDAGWPVPYNIKNFTAQSDLGDIGQLLDNAKFSTRSGNWLFDIDPDIEVFDLNAFLTRMGNSGHRANSDEITVLIDILTQAKSRPSRRGYDSMAEDLYRYVAGPTKDKLSGEGFSL